MVLDQPGVLLHRVVMASQHHTTGRPCWSGVLSFRCLSARIWAVPCPRARDLVARRGMRAAVVEPMAGMALCRGSWEYQGDGLTPGAGSGYASYHADPHGPTARGAADSWTDGYARGIFL